MIASLTLLIILLALSPLASKIPAAVLAGILVTVGIGVLDYKGLKALNKIPKTEVVVMVVVLLLSVFWNLVYRPLRVINFSFCSLIIFAKG